MLRAGFVFAAVGAVTLALLPFQAIAVWLDLPLRRRIPLRYHRMVCAILGIRIRESGRRMPEHPLLIVANHSSWLDISVIAAVAPVVFVAKREVAGWPVIGLLARLQRTVFVDRTRRHRTRDVNAEIAERLAQGDPVVLFGEGTSSDGNRVLPFRSALIGAARDALAEAEHAGRVWIQPLALAYTHVRGLPLSRHERPRVAWYGRMSLAPHLAGLARRGGVDVRVAWGEPVAFDQQSDRKEVARTLESHVRRRTVLMLRGQDP
jgi:lyso-ornithine lipid O-acyltransferase